METDGGLHDVYSNILVPSHARIFSTPCGVEAVFVIGKPRLKKVQLGGEEAGRRRESRLPYLVRELVLDVLLDPAQHEGLEDHVQPGKLV